MPVLANPKHELFAQERAQGRSEDEAYQLAGYRPNRSNAARLNANERVAARVAELQQAGAEKAEVSIAGVVSEFWRIATADPAELVEFQVGCCRYCWGNDHLYQRTPREQRGAEADFRRRLLECAGDADREAELGAFNEEGGVGFNATRAANPQCPECFGQGEGRAVFKDTRALSPDARALYAGVKITGSGGHEVKLHDKAAALTKLGQHLGMFIERRTNTDLTFEEFLASLDAGPATGDREAQE